MELWDVYDINVQKTGKTKVRSDKLEKHEFHLVVAVCVFNSEGKMLIQQRHPEKRGWPGMWDITAAGSAIHKETSRQAVARELKEEVGIEIDFSDKRPLLTVNFERGFSDYYCVEREVDVDSLSLQKDEVINVKWADIETIFKMIDNNEFIPYYKSLITAFFEMRNSIGSHIRNGF